jgi:hypothetical protein
MKKTTPPASDKDRAERLAEALRANLRRRKAQARATRDQDGGNAPQLPEKTD